MISYELAKKLKDAGWKGAERWKDYGNGYFGPSIGEELPSLEELIEACDGNIHTITGFGGKWVVNKYALNSKGNFKGVDLVSESHDIVEAVANFWLALNEKK